MSLSCMGIINNSNRIARSNETFLLSLFRSPTISILRGNCPGRKFSKGTQDALQLNRRTIAIARGRKLFLTFGGSDINPAFCQNTVLEFAISVSPLSFDGRPLLTLYSSYSGR